MLKLHKARDHENVREKCPRCSKTFSTMGALRRHEKQHNKPVATVVDTPLTVQGLVTNVRALIVPPR